VYLSLSETNHLVVEAKVGFEILMAVTMKKAVVWVVALCSLVDVSEVLAASIISVMYCSIRLHGSTT
jgi:hypothetical protein